MADVNAHTNPIVVSGVISSDQIITEDNISVQKIVWSGVTTAGHKMNLKDLAGNPILPLTADAPGTNGELMYTFDLPIAAHPCKGLVCNDMDSGQLLIYWTMRGPSQKEMKAMRLG